MRKSRKMYSTAKAAVQFFYARSLKEVSRRPIGRSRNGPNWYEEIAPRCGNGTSNLKRTTTVFLGDMDYHNLKDQMAYQNCAYATIRSFRNFGCCVPKIEADIVTINAKGSERVPAQPDASIGRNSRTGTKRRTLLACIKQRTVTCLHRLLHH